MNPKFNENIAFNQAREAASIKVERDINAKKGWRSKEEGYRTLFRDGEGMFLQVHDTASYCPYNGTFLTGGGGVESPNRLYEEMRWSESEGYVDDGNGDGDNGAGYGGDHYSIKHWKNELEEREYPKEVKEAVENSIRKGIEEIRLKGPDVFMYERTPERFQELLDRIDFGLKEAGEYESL